MGVSPMLSFVDECMGKTPTPRLKHLTFQAFFSVFR